MTERSSNLGGRLRGFLERRPYIIPTVAGLAAVLLMSTAMSNQFVGYDDYYFILQAPTSLREVGTVFLKPGAVVTYHPVEELSFFLDIKRYGGEPSGFRITNYILYFLTMYPVFFLLHGLLVHFPRRLEASALATLLFAVHPIHCEPVCWIASRKDLLSTLFAVLSLLAYLKGVKRDGERVSLRPGYHALSAFLFLLGILSKITVFPVLFAMPLVVYALYPEVPWRKILKVLPYAHLALALFFVTLSFFQFRDYGKFVAIYPKHLVPWSWGAYIEAVLVPLSLGMNVATAAPALPRLLIDLALLAAFLSIGIFSWKKERILFFGWAFALITFLPVSNLKPTQYLIADRYFYLPSLGVFLILAVLMLKASGKRRVLAWAVFLPWLVFLSTVTVSQSATWQNALTFAGNAVKRNPGSPQALKQLAVAEILSGRLEKAESLLKKVDPEASNPAFQGEWGALYSKKGDREKAIRHFEAAFREKRLTIYQRRAFVSYLLSQDLGKERMELALEVNSANLALAPFIMDLELQAAILARLDRCEEAMKIVGDMKGEPDESLALLEARIRCDFKGGKTEEAMKLLERYVGTAGFESPVLRDLLGLAGKAPGKPVGRPIP